MILRASSAVTTRQRPRSKRAQVRSPQTVRNRKASDPSLALENPRELPGSAGEVSAWRRRQCRPFLPDRKSDLGRTPQTGHDRCARSGDDGQISRPRDGDMVRFRRRQASLDFAATEAELGYAPAARSRIDIPSDSKAKGKLAKYRSEERRVGKECGDS